MHLRANTAVDVLIGPFVDSTDGNATEDGLTLSQADIKLSKNGQALAQKNDVTAAAFDDDGYYNCELDVTDTNTEGNLVLIVHEAGALPVRHEYNVLSEAAWDSLYAAKDTGFMDVNIKAISEDEGAADNSEAFFDGTGYAGTNNVIPLVTVTTTNTDMVTEPPTAAAIVDEWETQSQADPTGFHVNLLEIGGQSQTANDNGADINTILSRIIGTLATGTHNPATAAQIAVLSDWINGGRLDLLLDAIPTTAMRGTDGANTTVPDAAGTAPTAVQNRQEMDTNSTQLAAIVADTNELQTDDVPGLIATVQVDLDTITGAAGALLDTTATSSQLVDDIWDEVISKAAHNVAQSAAKIVRQGGDLAQIDGSISDASPTTTDFDTGLTQIDGYFDDALMVFSNGAANAGIGKHVSAYVNANGNVTFVAAMAWPVTPVNGDDFTLYAIHAHPVSEIQSGLATEAKQDTAQIDLDKIDELTTQGDTNEAAIGALADLSASDVLTQVNAALDTAISELGVAAPAATPTLRTGLMLMYMMARNRIDVDTTGTDAMKIYNNAGTQIASKLITDDSTDYSEAEMT